MSDRQRLLLSPYRLPTHHQVYLNEDEMAAWLNGMIVLWHPALLFGGERPPRVDSAYDHEQPAAGRAYVMPDSPPQFLPDDWPDRVRATGALKLPAALDREATIRGMIEAVREAGQSDEGREHFGSPDQKTLLDLPVDRIRPFFGIGFGFLMVDSLFEAMDHERLLDVAGFWGDVHDAVKALLMPDGAKEAEARLQSAAGKLLSAREVLYAVNIHLLDVWHLTEDRLDVAPPAALAAGTPLNLMATGRALERLAEQHPDRAADLRAKLDEAIQPAILEVIGGVYREREDALLPVESQLWNLRSVDPTLILGDGSIVTTGHKIDFTDRVEIGRRVILGGRNSSLWTHNRQRTMPITIGSLVYIGSEIRMAPGSAIPARSIVGIGSVITAALAEEGKLIAGVPAKTVKELSSEDQFLIERKTRSDLPDDV